MKIRKAQQAVAALNKNQLRVGSIYRAELAEKYVMCVGVMENAWHELPAIIANFERLLAEARGQTTTATREEGEADDTNYSLPA